MKPLKISFILAYPRPNRAIIAWLALAVYFVAWVHVWNPFTWFVAGLLAFASVITWLEDRKNPLTYQALFVVWLLFPFQMAFVFWLLEVLQ